MAWVSCDCDCCRKATFEIKRLQARILVLTMERDVARAESAENERRWDEACEINCRDNEAGAAHADQLRARIAELEAMVEGLGSRICEFHDTNPLNEVVVRLEKERDEALRRAEGAQPQATDSMFREYLRLRKAEKTLEEERDEWKALAQIHAEDRNEALRKGHELKDTIEALERESEERRQRGWQWRDAAIRVFRLWNPTGAEYDHWIKNLPELGRNHWHLGICSKQSGPVQECSVCQGRSGYDLILRPKNTVEALEAENRVVRELVEDVLDRLWVRDKEHYQRILDRCTWTMGEEAPLNTEAILERLGIRIRGFQTNQLDWEIRIGERVVGHTYYQHNAAQSITAISETIAKAVRTATDPLLARIAALTREYEDYMTIAGHCTTVYSHFSDGHISKPFTLPSEVIAEAEAIQQEDFETWHQQQLEPIKNRLLEFARGWERGGNVLRNDHGNSLWLWIDETFKETP